MDRVKIVIGNHGVAAQIEDIVTTLAGGFAKLGVRTDYEVRPVRGCMNVLIENFAKKFTAEVESLRGAARFIVVVTEFVTGDTFNDFSDRRSRPVIDWTRKHLRRVRHRWRKQLATGAIVDPYYDEKTWWKKRYNRFLQIARMADAVWGLSETQLDDYRRIPGLPPIGHLELGWFDSERCVAHRVNGAKDIDFLFTGTRTEYRNRILDALRTRGYRVASVGAHTPWFARENLVSRSRICLNLKQSEDWQHNSVMRMHYHVMNRSLLLTERTARPCHLLDYGLSCESAQLLEKCAEFHAIGDYNERATILYEKYRSATSLQQNLANLIAETLG